MLLLLPWAVIAIIALRPQIEAPDRTPAPAAASPYDDYLHQSGPGPWGELQYSRLLIEPPDLFVPNDYMATTALRWVFPGYTAESLAKLWTSAGLDETQKQSLSSGDAMVADQTGIVVRPTPALALSLSTEARTKIYSVLAAFPENPDQNEPFRFRADSADEWFEDCELSPDTIAKVKQLLYRRGTSLLFSDHNLILPQLQSRTERIQLVKTLARKSTLLVKLRVRPTDDLEEIADYWGRGPRRKDMLALLKSISRRPRGTTIDVAHLLPRFARSHLFTYRLASTDPVVNAHDCHWTSLNFFNDVPDERFADVDIVRATLENDYVPAVGRLLLGDILVFMRPGGDVVHSCVYVADDIVFTKNGASEVMPWILMNLPDVIAFYPADPPLEVRAYRRKDL